MKIFDKNKGKEENVEEGKKELEVKDPYAGLNESQINHLKRMEEAEK